MDIFEFAMEREKLSENYYRELACKASSKGLAKIFNMLADEEAKHFRVIGEMQAKIPQQASETNVLSKAKDAFEEIRGGEQEFDFGANEVEVYKKAQQMEEKSRDFYFDLIQFFRPYPGKSGISCCCLNSHVPDSQIKGLSADYTPDTAS